MKSVERIACRHGEDGFYYAMMPPAGACAAFGGGGDLFGRPGVIVQDHICCASLTQFNTS
jgi:hypothetical protein